MTETLTILDRLDLEKIWPIPAVYLLHGKGGSSNGTVKKLNEVFQQHWPDLHFERPLLRHSDPVVRAEESFAALAKLEIPHGALLVGVSLGGLLAAKLQETGRKDLKVIAISSPTWADRVRLDRTPGLRLALYSSSDEVIASRTSDWPQLASLACDCDWLTHDTDRHLGTIAEFFDGCLKGDLLSRLQRLHNEP